MWRTDSTLALALAMTCGIGTGAGRNGSWIAANAGIPSASFGVAQLPIDPATPSTLYAVTNLGTIFKSTDSAGSWNPVRGVTGVGFLAIDSRNTSTLYAASPTSGIYKSTDGGATWRASSNGLTDGASIVAVDPVTPSTLYSANYHPADTYSLGVNLLFKSMDGGQNWSPLTNFPVSNSPIGCVAIDPVTSSTLYVATESGEILESTDGGESWTFLMGRNGAGFAFVPLAIDPQTPSTLYAGSFAAFQGLVTPGPFDDGTGTISKSTDGGQTWTVIRTGIPTQAIVASLSIDPARSGTIYGSYVGDSGTGIIKSLDGGNSWTVINTFSSTATNSTVAIVPASSMVYAGYSGEPSALGGILKSADGGSSWNSADAGLDYIDLRALRLDPKHPGVLYTAGAAGLFRSVDNGTNWSAIGVFQVESLPVPFPGVQNPFGPGQGIVRSLLIDPSNPNNLYASVARSNGGCYYNDQLVFKSTDGGTSWSNAISPSESGCLISGVMAIDPVNPSILYIQETDGDDGIYNLLQTTDGGAIWSVLWDSPTGVNALLIDPTNTAVIYAGLETGFCKTADGGATWQCNALRNISVTTLALDPDDPSTLYAGTGSGLFLSKDGGANWTAASNGPAGTITSLVAAGPSGVVYAATSGNGVYRSTDGGGHWSAFNDGLASLDVRALAFAPGLPGTLYAATASGVFKMAGSNFRVGRVR